MYKPKEFNVAVTLLTPKEVTVKGSLKKTFSEDHMIYCSFRTFGGTETVNNGVMAVENTAVIETWYDEAIKADCRIRTLDGTEYEILGTPEDIQLLHKYMKFKIRAIKGGA